MVTTGERLREYVVERTHIATEKTLSVPTGIDAQRFISGERDTARRALGLPTDRSMIGIVATIRTWKGHAYLVEALAKLKQTNLELLIVLHYFPHQKHHHKVTLSLIVRCRLYL